MIINIDKNSDNNIYQIHSVANRYIFNIYSNDLVG